MEKFNFLIFFFTFLFKFIYLDPELKKFQIGKSVTDYVDGVNFYEVELTNRNAEYLIVDVKPPDNYEKYSDPDVYISRDYKYPSSYANSTWYSTNIGEDMVPILNKDLVNSTKIYVGVSCKPNCSYNMTIYYVDKLDLLADSYYILNVGNETTRIFHYVHTSNKTKFEIFGLSGNSHDLNLKVSYVYGSNNEIHFSTRLSWLNGYSVLVDIDSLYKCDQCYFRIEAVTSENTQLLVGVRLKNSIIPLYNAESALGTLDQGEVDCYSLDTLLAATESQDTPYILTVHSFLLNAKIFLTKAIDDTKVDKEYSIQSDLVIKILNKEMKGQLLCVAQSTDSRTSYLFKIEREDTVEENQRKNFLINGMMLNGYLPAGNVTMYRHWKMDMTSSTLNINLKVIKGSPVLYGDVCMDLSTCYYNSKIIKTRLAEEGDRQLFYTTPVNDNYYLSIPNEKNTCAEYMKSYPWKANTCSVVAIVYCEGTKECQYSISMSNQEEVVLLQKGTKISKFVAPGKYDYYQFRNTDFNVQSITVVLHSHTGDSDLYGSRIYSKAEDDPNSLMSASVGNRDSLFFTNENPSNNTLMGDFYISVRGYTYSYYTIYFYTSTTGASIGEYRTLDSGYILSDTVSRKDEMVFYNFFNRETIFSTPYIITFNTLNCDGEAYYINSKQEVGFPLSNFKQHSQYTVTNKNDFYNSPNGYTFGFKVTKMDSNSTSLEDNCTVFVGGVEEGNELLLNEGFPHIYTLEPKKSFYYVYPHAFDDNSAILSVYFEQFGSLTLRYRVGEYSFTESIFFASSVLIPKSILKDNCNTALCNIHINITYDSLSDVESTVNPDITYRILAKSLNKKPVYLGKNHIKYDSITSGVYQYYYTDIIKGDSGEIILQDSNSELVIVGKLVKNTDEEGKPDYYNNTLPTIIDLDTLPYNYATGSIQYTQDDTEKCRMGCKLYIGVYLYDKYSYNYYLNHYSILVSTANSTIPLVINNPFNGKIEDGVDMSYYKVTVIDDVQTLRIDLTSYEYYYGNLYVNFGEDKPTAFSSDWASLGQSYSVNELKINVNDPFLKKKGIKTLFNTTFTIGVGKAVYNSFSYTLTASLEYTDVPPLYEVYPGAHKHCEITRENGYCDFLIHVNDPSSKQVLVYAKMISELKEVGSDLEFFVNTYYKNSTNYKDIQSKVETRPREGTSKSSSKGFLNKPILVFSTPKHLYAEKEYLMVVSVRSKKKGTLSILTDIINDVDNTLMPKAHQEYLIYLGPGGFKNVTIGTNKGFYMAKFNRIYGSGTIEYGPNNEILVVDRNSTSTQIVIKETEAVLMVKGIPNNYLIMVMKYETNSKRNIDRIDIGPSQNIYYPDAPNDFPIRYYIPLTYINMDLTLNFQFKHVEYDSKDKSKELTNYKILSMIVDDQYILKHVAHNKTVVPRMLGAFNGKFDSSLMTGRVTIPAGKYNRTEYAVIFIQPEDKKSVKKMRSFTMHIMAYPENSLHYNMTLPQNTYFYSLIDTNSTQLDNREQRAKVGHVYKLTKESFKDKFIAIELASCSGDVDYALRDIDPEEEVLVDKNPSILLNKTKHEHSSYEYFGKRIIEVNLKDQERDLVIAVFPKGEVENWDCNTNNEKCTLDNAVGYAIRYRSFSSKSDFDFYTLGDKGLVSSEIKDSKDVILKFSETKSSKNKPVNAKYYFRLFYDSHYESQLATFESICFAHSTVKVYYADSYSAINKLLEFPTNVNYIVSILAEITEPGPNYGTLLVYTPVKILLNSSTVSIWLLLLFIFVSFFLMGVLFYFYRKYKQTKLQLDYEVNDIRNLASIPKTSGQISEMRTVKSKEKYTTLNESV